MGYVNLSFFDNPRYTNDKPIRLIEMFSGIGAQAKAMTNLGLDYEKYKTSEWDYNAVASYKAIHYADDTMDYSKCFTTVEVEDELIRLGISNDGKQPMTEKQIRSKNESWKRRAFNNFKATHNVGSITNIHGCDLEIVDTDKYTYVLTYSFPCQDLSVAGLGKGFDENSGTRSALLWEVKRLLDECDELPQILLMENVPQVHGKKNLENFNKWIAYLESKGYSNVWQDLNAKNYGVPQNRNRTFMVSMLGEWDYEFPEGRPLTKRLMDVLEDNVDEKYYLSSEYIEYAQRITEESNGNGNNFKFNPVEKSGGGIAVTVTSRAGQRVTDNFVRESL